MNNPRSLNTHTRSIRRPARTAVKARPAPVSVAAVKRQPALSSKPKPAWKEGQAKIRKEGSCRRCPETYGLHPHHVVHKGPPFSGDDHADNCIPLCFACHRVWHDDKAFDIWPLLTTAEKIHAIDQLGEGRARELLIPSKSPKRIARAA